MLAALIAAVVLLRDVLLPFVAGMVLAYLLDPLATRLEGLGMNRLIATLTIVGLFIVGVVALIVLAAPIFVKELAYFIDNFPLYVRRLHGLATDPNRPWLRKIIGEGLGHAEQSLNELTTLATDWVGTFLRSIWSGGRALISVFSLLVVTPIVACYLIYDWKRMIAVIDNWVPPAQRDTVRTLARDIDDTIGGFVIGQGALCLILALFYAVALSLVGLKHGLLIGLTAGLISFVPYLGSLTGLVVSTCVAVAQFWPNWAAILIVPAIFFVGESSGRLRSVALFRRSARQLEPRLGHVCVIRVRLFVRFLGPFDCGAACGRCRRARALRVETVLREPTLCRQPDGVRCCSVDPSR